MSRQHRPHPRDIVVVVGGNGNPKGVVRVHTIARHARPPPQTRRNQSWLIDTYLSRASQGTAGRA
eukprot:197943-Prymnesium_polylepis.1